MFTFERSQIDIPDFYLSGEASKILSEILRFMCLDQRERDQSKLPFEGFEYPYDLHQAVIRAGRGRCAFCEETSDDLMVYPFRPPGNVEPRSSRSGREYYLWLMLTWRNLFPICPSCRPKDRDELLFPMKNGGRVCPPDDVFRLLNERIQDVPADQITDFLYSITPENLPTSSLFLSTAADQVESSRGIAELLFTTDKEKPLFYEPGAVKQPARSFDVKLSGEILARSPFQEDKVIWQQSRAAATLAHFNLNADQKVAARGSTLREKIEWLLEYQYGPADDLFDFANMDFGSAWYLMLYRIGERWCPLAGVTRRLAPSQIKRTFEKLSNSDTRDVLGEVLDELREEDAGHALDSIPTIDFKSIEEEVPSPTPELLAQRYKLIQSVSIRNFKALEAIDIAMPKPEEEDGKSDGDQPGALLLLGENATGKSSILEAITLGCISPDAFDALNPDSGKCILNPRYMGQRLENSQGEKDQRDCEIIVTLEGGAEFRTRLSRAAPPKRQMRTGPRRRWRKINEQDAPLIFAYGAHRLFGRKSDSHGPLSNVCTLFDDGQLVTDPEAWMIRLYENDPDALDSVVAQLRSLISIDGHFTSIEVVPDPDKTDALSCEMHMNRSASLGDKDEGYKVIMPLAAVSSGYRTIIALFCDILAGLADAIFSDDDLNERRIEEILQTPCTILIDEIEAHLHPRWKMNVISGLRKVLPNARFLITSHDPLCIRGMSRGEIFVLNRLAAKDADQPEDLLEQIETHTSDLETDLFTVQQILTSDLFNLMTTDSQKGEDGIASLADGAPDDATLANQIARALPVGNSDVERLVQVAVREYLEERRRDSNAEARQQAIKKIKDILSDTVL